VQKELMKIRPKKQKVNVSSLRRLIRQKRRLSCPRDFFWSFKRIYVKLRLIFSKSAFRLNTSSGKNKNAKILAPFNTHCVNRFSSVL
jgi:hypothetical protein